MTSNLAGSSWQGASAQAMTAAAAPYTAWLGAAAAHSELASQQSKMVARAYEAARAATVKLEAIAANRTTLVQLIRANWFGHLAPAIAATEAHYEGMWVQDVTAMAGYHAGASAAGGALAASAVTVTPPPAAKAPPPSRALLAALAQERGLKAERERTAMAVSTGKGSSPARQVLAAMTERRALKAADPVRSAAAITLGAPPPVTTTPPPPVTTPGIKAPVRAPIRLEKAIEVVERAGR